MVNLFLVPISTFLQLNLNPLHAENVKQNLINKVVEEEY